MKIKIFTMVSRIRASPGHGRARWFIYDSSHSSTAGWGREGTTTSCHRNGLNRFCQGEGFNDSLCRNHCDNGSSEILN